MPQPLASSSTRGAGSGAPSGAPAYNQSRSAGNAGARGRSTVGATACVTLAPGGRHGRTGPCCDALVGAGVARVVASLQDPNPRVTGQGFARLRAAVVRAGLQRDVGGSADGGMAARGGMAQRHHLGVGLADGLRVPLAEQLARFVHQHAADRRIGRADETRLFSQRERAAHAGIGGGQFHGGGCGGRPVDYRECAGAVPCALLCVGLAACPQFQIKSAASA